MTQSGHQATGSYQELILVVLCHGQPLCASPAQAECSSCCSRTSSMWYARRAQRARLEEPLT